MEGYDVTGKESRAREPAHRSYRSVRICGSDSARAGAASLGKFMAATCVDTIDDQSKVEALAHDNSWSVEANPGEFASSWTLAQDGIKVIVGTATAKNQDLSVRSRFLKDGQSGTHL
jgi:hypothetical protein